MKFPSRLLASILCAALLGGLIPPEAAAQVAPVRLSVGGTAGAGTAAASVNAPLSLNSASLGATLTPAPGLSAAYAPAASVSAAPSAAAASAAAPAAAPALSAAAPLAAAAEGPANEAPETPKAAAPAPAAKSSWLSRATSLFRRSSKSESAQSSAPAAPAADAASDKAAADKQFDGAAEKPASETTPVFVPKNAAQKTGFFLARFVHNRVEAYKAHRAVEHDGFGGPKAEPTTFAGRVGYGVKWGLNLIGVSALIDWVFTPLISHLAWPLWLSPTAMHGLGRVELLIKYGPAQIGAALQHAAVPFLGIALPVSTWLEEFNYRFLSFGLAFGLLALAKPAAKGIAKILDQIPDASGFRSKIQKLALAVGGAVSFFAFPAAAAYSAFGFATAHFAKWGVDPSVFALNIVAGYVLARIAYKTRGLTAPFVAHLVFNLAMLGGGILAVTFGMPMAGMIYPVLTSVVGLGALWYNWRSARKAFKFKLSSLANGAKTLVIAALISASVLGGYGARQAAYDTAAFHAQTLAGITVKTEKPAAAPQDTTAAVVDGKAAAAAPAATQPAGPVEAQADMIARVKPTVVQIIVKMPEGTAIGSGVIVTPDGKIVTNAHVVGPKQVGQIVIVELIDGTKVPGKILAVNHDRDQAILQLPRLMNKETKELVAWPYSVFAKTAPREGDEVFAMGHPLGLPFTVTKGIVSGLGSRSNMYVQYLQTDASINHGNSGGPLYNRAGEIVGINTMGVDESHNVGFSIIAPSVVRALIQYQQVGNINTAALGVIVDLSNPDQPELGVAVEFVRPGSAAAKAGIQPGDIIVGAAGEKIDEAGKKAVHDLSAILAQAKPGDTIEIAVVRGDKLQIVKIVLDAKKTSEETSAAHGFDGEE